MRNSPDPSVHRQRETLLMQHVDRLLDDDRLRVDTLNGRRPVPTLGRRILVEDREVELKRLMSQLDVPDRDLQNRMPVGRSVTVTLWKSSWFFFKKNIGQIKVVSLAPAKALLKGESPTPMGVAEVRKVLAEVSPAGVEGALPVTVVLMSTSGFAQECRDIADRRADRTLILVEPNDAGGWNVAGPVETQALVDLFDPEAEASKRQRVRESLDAAKADLLTGSVSAPKVATATQLPLQMVEQELKSYAKATAGLTIARQDGQMLLYREGFTPSADSGGSNMPFWEKVKGIFRREETLEKKVSRLASERAGLSHQREAAYEEISILESKESALTKNYAGATSLAQKRIATEISQLRKDMERRQQILGAIDRKINIIETGIHNLKMKDQLAPEKLQNLEGIAEASEDVEAGLATLQQLDEEANATLTSSGTEISDDVASIMEELKAKTTAPPEPAKAEPTGPAKVKPEPVAADGPNRISPERERQVNAPPPLPGERRPARPEPEAG